MRAGLHRTYLSDIERGARNLSLESIEKLARALGISMAALFSYAPLAGELLPAIPGELAQILYVEDNPADIELTMDALKSIPNHIEVVRDGAAAIDYLFGAANAERRRPRFRPQLILLDLKLPKIDGLEVLRRIKSEAKTASIPVIVLTASSSDRDIQTSRRLGAASYIVKPLNLRSLVPVAAQIRMQWALLPPMASGDAGPRPSP